MTIETTPTTRKTFIKDILFSLLIILVFLGAVYFRFTGIFWGEYSFMHPDERFLIWVGTDISPITCENPDLQLYQCPEDQRHWMSLSEYFDSARSSLNPENRGHGFYVYGTLPMFLTRYVVQWIYSHSGFEEMTNVGRVLSAVFDLMTVLLVFLIGSKVYDRRVGILGAAFMAVAVLHIQQSHFFTMDTFITFFTILAFYFAIIVSLERREWLSLRYFYRHPLFLPSLAFGITLGMAVASKLNAFLMAGMLPVAMLICLARFPAKDRWKRYLEALVFLLLAAFISLLTFRIFQPYAFTGPSFFNIFPSEGWLNTMNSLSSQRSLDVDFPPAMQWARRSIFFSGENLTVWGLGLPLGILAWSGFIWVGWRILTSIKRSQEWQQHTMIWVWTAIYFAYQSIGINPTMRYEMPIYPTLAILAAWTIFKLWDTGKQSTRFRSFFRLKPKQILAILIGGFVLILSISWAFAFTRIYNRPFTRVEASRWILNNIPGAINLQIQTEDGLYNQPLPIPSGFTLESGVPYQTTFQAKQSGSLNEIYFPHILDKEISSVDRKLEVLINQSSNDPDSSSRGILEGIFSSPSDTRGSGYTLTLDQPVSVVEGENYAITVQSLPSKTVETFSAEISLRIRPYGEEIYWQTIPQRVQFAPDYVESVSFIPEKTGVLDQVSLSDLEGFQGDTLPSITLVITSNGDENELTRSELLPIESTDPGVYLYYLANPIVLTADVEYQMQFSLPGDYGQITIQADTLANEGEWDDGLPLRLDGYDPFGGIYPPDVNFNMYWDDNPDKLTRFLNIMNSSDYIVFSSNRQWGTLTRIPERFPFSTVYYRNLLGCPPEKDIVWCYRVAEPGMFQGNLGFELVKIFQSDPSIGPLEINDQFAEEAFTVYDHPKVFIFKKTSQYNEEQVQNILGSVDFDKIIKKPPLRYSSNPADLLLPIGRWITQRLGGTWSELFNPQSLLNRFPALSAIAWYFAIFIIGLVAFPIVRATFPGLPDRGYPLSRIAGMLLISYLAWLAGSANITVSRGVISLVFVAILLLSAFLAFHQRKELVPELRSRWKYYLVVEGIFLGFFLLDLLIRLGNPDIWHPYKGGEKPMDFAYFNAVLKSSTFPPYDPWYAGGYINYYYYGFVLAGIFVKWLGITPSVAYNLIIPTLFAMIAVGAFSVAWNLFSASSKNPSRVLRYVSGIAAAVGSALIGNLGTIGMVWEGLQRLGGGVDTLQGTGFFTRLLWAGKGIAQVIVGRPLPFGLGEWYWNPSRIIPSMGDVQPITEFPFFTVLYADLHAHLFALPITILALSFAVSIVLSKARWKGILEAILGFFIGGLAIGALRPTNTWDFPVFLVLGMLALGYAIGRYWSPPEWLADKIPLVNHLPLFVLRLLVAILAMVLLASLSVLLFLPYTSWYALGYSKVSLWNGPRTPLNSYLFHWGLFLFIIISWIIWEYRQWMENTAVVELRKIQKYAALIAILVGITLLLTIFLAIKLPGLADLPFGKGVQIVWLTIPLACFAGVLIFRSDLPDAKRIVLFLVGSGLFLSLLVEIVVLVGDVGRMNTVFKFYLQIWTLFSISAAVGLGWLLQEIHGWYPAWRRVWQVVLGLLIFGAALYPIFASNAKIRDRMVTTAPHTLDGMEYMKYATYDWNGPMELSQDYEAIQWMQQNIEGSPVIVEANLRDLYRWGSRYSIYTGLPSIVGWEWHQQQQRATNPSSWVSERIAEVDDFYKTLNLDTAKQFLEKYDVEYIVVGQLERNIFPNLSLEKFDEQNGILWKEVYRNQDTVIYRVIKQDQSAEQDE
jgi:YYY domain-containing protein